MKLVIAEKPSVAQSLAAVIGATARKDGYLEGNGWRVSWCVGHLAGLADADSYDLCLNSSVLGIDGCVEMIKKMLEIKRRSF